MGGKGEWWYYHVIIKKKGEKGNKASVEPHPFPLLAKLILFTAPQCSAFTPGSMVWSDAMRLGAWGLFVCCLCPPACLTDLRLLVSLSALLVCLCP